MPVALSDSGPPGHVLNLSLPGRLVDAIMAAEGVIRLAAQIPASLTLAFLNGSVCNASTLITTVQSLLVVLPPGLLTAPSGVLLQESTLTAAAALAASVAKLAHWLEGPGSGAEAGNLISSRMCLFKYASRFMGCLMLRIRMAPAEGSPAPDWTLPAGLR